MAMVMEKAIGLLFLLLVVSSEGDARPLGSSLQPEGSLDAGELWCEHWCRDLKSVCVAENCVQIPRGDQHNRCHLDCQEANTKCNAKCYNL